MSIISIVVALADDNAIGKDQQLLWHLPCDMRRFKELTTGHTVLMGRKTFESLPKGALPNRKNVVLTTMAEADFPNCVVFDSLPAALDSCEGEEEVFIIGGAQVYKQALAIADRIYLTQVHHTFADADTFFPEIDFKQWKEVERQEFPVDEKHAYAYTFLTLNRLRTAY